MTTTNETSNLVTNVDDYTIPELLAILGEPSSTTQIIQTSNEYIDKYENEGNEQMSKFFQDIQNKLLDYQNQVSNGTNSNNTSSLNSQTKNWWENSPALAQDDLTQTNKITERKQKIDIYGNEHVPMTRQQLGVNNNYNVPVVQDKLNPTLENITTRFILLDSSYRDAGKDGENSSSTNYVCDLTDTIKNVLSLRLYSIQIPYAWYNINYDYGNTCFWIYNNGEYFEISISSGNYNTTTLLTEINNTITTAGFVISSTTTATDFITYNTTTGKTTINLYGSTDPYGNTLTETSKVIFYDYENVLMCSTSSSICNNTGSNNSFDNTLGWILGFRTPSIFISSSGNISTSLLNIHGPKYFIVILDDFNQNHLNNSLITITELDTKLDIPSYYTSDMSFVCKKYDNVKLYNNLDVEENENIMYITSEKITNGLKTVPYVIPNAPRTMTQSQIYTINEIFKNNSKTTRYKKTSANPTDTFAVITIDANNYSLGSVLSEDGSSLQMNKRTYFGPVNIDSFKVKLVDDRGNVVSLNGLDWNMTLIAETLYQY